MTVLGGYELLDGIPQRLAIDTQSTGDHGADPIGDGTFRMVPSGDVVTMDERNRRLRARRGGGR